MYSTETDVETFDIVTDTKVAEGAAWRFVSGKSTGLTKIIFGLMDAWFEEDEQIFVHPRDPYKVRHFVRKKMFTVLIVC